MKPISGNHTTFTREKHKNNNKQPNKQWINALAHFQSVHSNNCTTLDTLASFVGKAENLENKSSGFWLKYNKPYERAISIRSLHHFPAFDPVGKGPLAVRTLVHSTDNTNSETKSFYFILFFLQTR